MKASYTHSNPKQLKGVKQPKVGKHANTQFKKKQEKLPVQTQQKLPPLNELLKGK